MSTKDPQVGEFAVINDGSFYGGASYRGGAITKLSAKCVYYKSFFENSYRAMRDRLVFSGGQNLGKKLLEQLKSSEAQRQEDHRNAGHRHTKRCEGFIEKANVQEGCVSGDSL